MLFRRLLLSLAVFSLVAFSGQVLAQTQTASLTGQVVDATGAAVPGAQVLVTDPAKGSKVTVTSDASGDYNVPELQPADDYKIVVTKPGFKTTTQQNVVLQVAQAAKINVTMAVGDATESVTVEAAPPQLDTQSSSLGQVITGQSVADLPLNGRSTFRLIALTPGVTFSQSAFGQFGDVAVNSTFDTNFSINGGRTQSNEILIDGVPSSAGFFDQITTLPVVDETQEFKVQSSNLSAQYGRYSGGVINVTTKGGTNQYHGNVYEFARNSMFDANEWFQKHTGGRVPFSMNQFGGTIGGPVRIPKLYNGRDKTFFFFSYQGTRRLKGNVTQLSVPTAAERAGDFSAAPILPIYNPFQSNTHTTGGAAIRPQFSYNGTANVIDPALLDPVAVAMTKYIPLPNTGPAGALTKNYVSNAPLGVTQDIFSGRIDQNVTQKYHLQGRYAYSNTPLSQPDTYGNVATPGAGAVGVTTFKTQSFALNNIYQFSDHFLVNANYGFARWFQSRVTRSFGFDNSTLGFPAAFVQSITIPMFPGVAIGGGYTGLANQSYLNNGNDSHAVLISATWLKGKHTINFGVDGRMHRINFFNVGNTAGLYNFAVKETQSYTETQPGGVPTFAAVAKTGDGYASFLIGAGSTGNNNIGGSFPIGSGVELQDLYAAVYVQDDIRLTEKLTVNLGLRYDGESPYTDRHNELNYFDPNVASPARNSAFPNLTGGLSFATQNGNPRTVYTAQHGNVAPRLGFAWSPYSTTTFRGGWGISYAPLETSDNAVGFSPSLGFASTTNWSVSNDGFTPTNLLRNPFPQGVIKPTGSTLGAGTQLGQSLSVWTHNPKTPYAMQWNLDLEQQFPGGFLFDAGYSGSRGEHLTSDFDDNTLDPAVAFVQKGNLNALVPNPFQPFVTVGTLAQPTVTKRQLLLPFPQFGSITEINKGWGNSYYHSAQIKGVKRMSHGLQFLAAFTWSKLISDVNAQEAPIGTVNDSSTQDYYNLRGERSLSEFDQPFNFVFNTSWELPFGRGRAWAGNIGPGLNKLVGGWKLSGIWTEQSGNPLTFTSTGVGIGSRPDLYPGGVSPIIHGSRSNIDRVNLYFNNVVTPGPKASFVAPQPYQDGTVPRAFGLIRGPGLQNLDATLQKDIEFGARYRAELRAEFFNVTNTPHFSNPNTALQNANFGQITSTVVSPPEREIQFAGKFFF
jgi:hypothetical protein